MIVFFKTDSLIYYTLLIIEILRDITNNIELRGLRPDIVPVLKLSEVSELFSDYKAIYSVDRNLV